jgi:2-methylcitrate dehydratase PrpD
MIRLGRAIDGAHVVYSGLWPSCLCAPFGTAAVTAQLLGLDPARTGGALSLAMTMAMSTGGGHHAQLPGRWLTIGQGARAGCVAALAAARGYSAPLDLRRYPPATIDTTALLSGGEARAIEEVSVKPSPGAKQTMAATEAALRLRDRVALDDIRRIVVSVPEWFVGMIAERPDEGRQSRLVSVAWNVALALCCPDRLADLERAVPADPDLRRLADLVAVKGDPELSAAYPARWPARLEIHTSHGVIEEFVTESRGDPGTNQAELLAEKWQQVLGPSAARWRERCSEGIASVDGMRRLAAELRSAPRANGLA